LWLQKTYKQASDGDESDEMDEMEELFICIFLIMVFVYSRFPASNHDDDDDDEWMCCAVL
jgi:hypothetical protein